MRKYIIYYIIALLALTSDASAAKILGLFPHTGRSHQMVFEPLLRRLAERGHHVTSVSFFPLKNPPANYTDVSLEGIASVGIETIDLELYENSNKLLKILGVNEYVKQVIEFHPLSEMALNVCEKLVDWPALTKVLKKEYDVVLVENFNSDCMLGLLHIYDIKAPVVALLSSGLMPWSSARIGVSDNPSYVPALASRFTNKMTFFERLENTLVQLYLKLWYRYAVQVKEQEIIERHFGKRIPDLEELANKVSLMLVNSYHSMRGVIPLLPGVVEVGGMHLDPNRKVIPQNIERFVNESEHGVVLFSFGSLIKTSTIPKYKEEMIVRVLSKLKQRVIWKYEDSSEEGTLHGNILKVRWLPQYELLQHKNVVAYIAHGGMLGMIEAVSAGKPMVVVPFYGDQPGNGVHAAAAGLARVVSYTDFTEEKFSEALHSVLSAETRLSARRASKIWRDRESTPLESAVYWTEYVIRWGADAPLYSAARDLSFIQYTLLDVTAALIVTILIIILLLKLVLSLIFRYVSASLDKNSKLKTH